MHRVSGNGGEMPALGFGTWRLEGRDCEVGVRHALELGYRHIDAAQMCSPTRRGPVTRP